MQTERSVEAAPELGARAEPESIGRRAIRILGVRRRFIIDRRGQFRAGMLTTSTSLVLLILLNLSLYSSREQAGAKIISDAPELATLIQSQNLLELVLVLASSLVFLIGVFVVTVLETHKTAGAAYNLRRHMDEIRQGQYNTRIHLRHDDTLLPLADSFNAMSMSLESHVWQEVEALEKFADRAGRLTGPADSEDLGREIRARAAEIRHLAE